MAYARIEPSGCCERYGLIQTRFDIFLNEGDKRYNDLRFYQIDQTSKEYLKGYQGLVDLEGNPLDSEQYQAWRSSLPRMWLPNRQINAHFLYFEPTVSQDDILKGIEHHIPNFYRAWIDEWDLYKGGMRHGWDVACRKRPRRYNKIMSLQEYQSRKLECLSKVDLIKTSNLSVLSKSIGEIFPATEIDIGLAAEDRGAYLTNGNTLIDKTNPANDTGSIDTWEIYAFNTNMGGTKAGTASGSGTSYTPRDYADIGTVETGAKRTFTGLDVDVETGDFSAIYYSSGYIESDTSGYGGVYYRSGDQFGAGAQTYTLNDSDRGLSLYGTGETAAPAGTGARILQVGMTGMIQISGG